MITTQLEVDFTPAGCSEQECATPTFEIDYRYTPGAPEQGPSYASGGQPADPPEVEFLAARCIDGDGLDLTQQQVDDYCADWLDGDGWESACEQAEQDRWEAGA
jgi:hypothetical protein